MAPGPLFGGVFEMRVAGIEKMYAPAAAAMKECRILCHSEGPLTSSYEKTPAHS